MKQVFVSGTGEVQLFDVPVPGPLPDSVLVRNAFSLVSSGTEGAAVSRHAGALALAERAWSSSARLRQVWDLARRQGVPAAWNAVQRKLDEHSALGYSCAGQVAEISGEVPGVRIGDWVACMGAGFATHSEYVVVPRNLVARLPAGVEPAEAAFGSLACIALQGLRRLEAGPGEWIGVIGLGLIGQIAAQLLKALGYRGIGFDLSAERAARAAELSGIQAWSDGEADARRHVDALTVGRGLDGVLVCAATRSDGPVNLAFDLCRKRGRVSVIGDVGLGLVRSKMYAKELELRMSCSYGPGRYDEAYEVEGRDYPAGYVRWTEGRNLELVLELLRERTLRLAPLVGLRCPIERAAEAYGRLKSGDHSLLGILIEYPGAAQPTAALERSAYVVRSGRTPDPTDRGGALRLGLIGCGKFTRAVHVPNLTKLSGSFRIEATASRTGVTAQEVARRTGAAVATSDYRILLDDPSIDAVLVATRHADHARVVLDALAAGKHVFVEKPLCLTVEEGEAIVERAGTAGVVLRVGFNRRFAPHMRALRDAVGRRGRRVLSCRVNLGRVENDWSNTPEEGGRFLGEGVHFLDLASWFMGELPIEVSATSIGPMAVTNPDTSLRLVFASGSVADVLYTSLGDSSAGKERYEAFGNGRTAFSDDFQTFRAFGSSGQERVGGRGDKGHLAQWEEFASAVRTGASGDGADAPAGLWATRMALTALESARRGAAVGFDRPLTPTGEEEPASIRPVGEAAK